MGSPTISQQKIIQAADGNAALLELLTQMAQTTAAQQSVTGTTPAAGPAQNSSAPVPPQATGYVSVLAGIYTVQLVNPGASSPLSQLQAAAAGNNLSPLQPVTTIFHQVRASTSPAFNVNSNTQTFGGNTGSTQTLWTLSGLGSGRWYFQFRSSYDGVNFNTWKNANSGSALGGLVDQVTEESAAFSEWALFSLPGSEIMGICEGLLADQEIMGIPPGFNLYSSGFLGIAGPNGFTNVGQNSFGITLCDIDLQIPAGGGATSGIPDYPIEIRMQYGQRGGSQTWPGIASVFGFAFNPLGKNVTLYEEGGTNGAVWAEFTLPGGGRIAIGQGLNLDGASIWTPPALTWMNSARMMSICSLTGATDTGFVPSGFAQNQLSGYTMQAEYEDGSETFTWPGEAHWLAIAWQQGVDVQTVGGFPFLTIPLQGGHAMVIGAGQSASGTPIALPAGYTTDKMLSICTPGPVDTTTGHHQMTGVQRCSFLGLTPIVLWQDTGYNTWGGKVNWMVAAWK